MEFCNEWTLPTVSYSSFGRKLAENAPSLQTVRRDNVRCWKGITMLNARYASKDHQAPIVIFDTKKDTNVLKGNNRHVMVNTGKAGSTKVKEWKDFT